MSKQENEAEAGRILGVVDAIAVRLWRTWAGDSLGEFALGLLVMCLVLWLLFSLLGG